MGCCSEKMMVKTTMGRLSLSDEETIITMKEKLLPFSCLTLSELTSSITHNQEEQIMSSCQFRKALTDIGVESEVFTDPESQVYIFLRILQNPSRLYDVRTVMLAGIVLSTSLATEKADALFSLYDSSGTKELKESEARKMIEEIIEVSVGKLPLLAKETSEEEHNFTLSEEKVVAYVENLMRKKDKYIQRALPVIMASSEKVNREEFVRRVSEHVLLEPMLWSYQLRLHLAETMI